MELEITVTARDTILWAAKAKDPHGLRHELKELGYLVRGADPFELIGVGVVPSGKTARR